MSYAVVFTLEHQDFAFDITLVERLIYAVEVNALPNAQDKILGVINIKGEIVYVYNLRKIFNFPDRELEPSDQMMLCEIDHQKVALWLDRVSSITPYEPSNTEKGDGNYDIIGSIKKDQKIILVYDLKKLLSLDALTLQKSHSYEPANV